jgi:hypothetical protein
MNPKHKPAKVIVAIKTRLQKYNIAAVSQKICVPLQ